MKSLKIGMLGLGTVGSGMYRILTGNAQNIGKKVGAAVEISKVLVRDTARKRAVDIDPSILTSNPEDVTDNKEIDIVVEVMGGIRPAYDYILRSLNNGKSVVTANKDLIAVHGKELLDLADKKGVDLLFEGSVAGGIPIIRPLKYCLAANNVQEVIGIINGTTNYILTKMTAEGVGLAETLKEAQQKGYAEADPTADVEGFDAARKLAILASLSFNARVSLDDVYIEGITKITKEDIAYGKDFNYAVKLLGIAKNTGDGIEARVHPCFIPLTHPLASVNDVFNAVFVKGDAVGDVMFYGRGAGDMPTGSAVASDVMEAARHKLNNTKGLNNICYEDKPVKKMGNTTSKFYLRLKAKDQTGVLAAIANALSNNRVSIESVIQKGTDNKIADIVLVTHRVMEAHMQKALGEIKLISSVAEICNLIRVEGE